jgi:hypothetical protein
MKIKFIAILSVLAIATLLGTSFYLVHEDNHYAETDTLRGESLYVINVSNDKELVGASTDVFIGKVIEQVGTSDEPYLRTHFSVEVIETIKGNATGKVIVNQAGGYETVDGKKYLSLMEEDELLQPGETYLFSARGNDERGYTFVPGYGDLLIKNQTDYQNKVQRFQKAHSEEIPFDPYKNRTTINQE